MSGEVTAISNANGEQETRTGNAVDLILGALYSIGGVAKEKSDQCLHYKTSQGGTFLVPTYHSTGGPLSILTLFSHFGSRLFILNGNLHLFQWKDCCLYSSC